MVQIHERNRLEEIAELLKENLNRILYFVIGIAVIAGIFMYIRQRDAERELTARTVLEEAKRHWREGELDDSLDYIGTVLQDYERTQALGEALLYGGRIAINANDYEEAARYLSRYIETYPDGALLPEVYSELGFIQEEKGDFEEAERFYSRIFREFPQSYLAPKSMIDAARCLAELGEAEEAAELYESILSIYPWSSFTEAAIRELESGPN